PDLDTTYENMRELKFVQLLINDLILGLCKLRDDNSNSFCFPQVLKMLRKRAASKDLVVNLEPEIKRYNLITHNLEIHRNTYIAHLAKRGTSHLKPPSGILEGIYLSRAK